MGATSRSLSPCPHSAEALPARCLWREPTFPGRLSTQLVVPRQLAENQLSAASSQPCKLGFESLSLYLICSPLLCLEGWLGCQCALYREERLGQAPPSTTHCLSSEGHAELIQGSVQPCRTNVSSDLKRLCMHALSSPSEITASL